MDDFAHIVGEDVHFRGRSPSGERGLKLHGRHALDGQRQVAPHLGSVGSYAGLIRWLMSVSSHLSLI